MVLSSVIFLLLCWAVGQSASRFHPIKKILSWDQAREFCRTHYADLAVLSTEEQYLRLQDAIAVQKATFWLGLKCENIGSDWKCKWLSNEDLSYNRWYRNNYGGRCGSFEAVVRKDRMLLARNCAETHNFVCQGECCLLYSMSTKLLNYWTLFTLFIAAIMVLNASWVGKMNEASW